MSIAELNYYLWTFVVIPTLVIVFLDLIRVARRHYRNLKKDVAFEELMNRMWGD